jgi:eukaryotic-like serine/threonine-protein kinase
MPQSRKCSRCGATLPRNAPDGYCMACFLQIGLDPLAELPPDVSLLPGELPGVEHAGDRIGQYKLLQQIGEGGCGVVYMAEQEVPVRRKVALKVIKLGMDTGQVIARFEAERQALAMMDHPNIAKVLDAGATGRGRPFFVMELVQGEPITAYCDHRQFSTRQRLELFIDLCHAVQHAHQKGIIHRDIKPSNILVTEVDGKPLPKIIDFGIAKATSNQRLTEKTYFTAFEQFIGTPAYMSPEQAGLGRQDVDSRSDIYSLGMLLYELLTSQPAFDAEELRQAGIDEVLRTIREKEPPRPSTRLTSLNQAQITSIARSRQTEPAKLSSLLQGDLDWIAMKSLEKDRQRRYETADALALDIQRHLNNEPVLARPPDTIYRLRKFVRRHKLAFAAGVAIALTLLLGILASTWQAVRATRAEREQIRLRKEAVAAEKTAQTEASKSREVAQFLKEMLSGVGPEVARGRDTELLRGILQKTADRIDHDLKSEPEVEAELRSTLGAVYEDLGDYPKAEVMHRAALAILRANPGLQEKDLAVTLNNLADTLDREGRYPEAEAMHRETLELRRKLFGNDHLDVAVSLNGLGTALWNQGRLTEAESCYRQAFAISAKTPTNNRPLVYMKTIGNLGVLLGREGKPAEAEKMFREVLDLQRKRYGDDSPEVAHTLGNLADALSDLGKLAEAEPLYREQLAMRRKLLGNTHPSLAFPLNNLAVLLYTQGKLEEAESLHREALAVRRTHLGNDHPFVAVSLCNLGKVLEARGETGEAEMDYRAAMSILRKNTGNERELADVLNYLAMLLVRQNNLAEAEALEREDLAIRRKLFGHDNPDVAAVLPDFSQLLKRTGKASEAEALQRELLSWRLKELNRQSPRTTNSINGVMDAYMRLVDGLLGAGKFSDSETLARDWVAFAEKESPDDWRAAASRGYLGASLLEQKRFAEAEPMLIAGETRLEQQAKDIPVDQHSVLQEVAQRLVRLYEAIGQPDKAADWKKHLSSGK